MRRDDPEEGKLRFFRTPERFFSVNGKWYFSAREGDQGPFHDRRAAESAAIRFIASRASMVEYVGGAKGKAGRPRQPLYRSILPMAERETHVLRIIED
ncbi:MAG: DUF6316 family protein [Pseudomonadales bacterium]